MPTHTISTVSAAVADKIKRKLQASRVDMTLIYQANRRVNAKGDSTHRYPELWATRTGRGQRAGGQPLRDTGNLLRSLGSATRPTGDGVEMILTDGSGYGLAHQSGFETKGPNFIPLTARAKRHRKGVDPKTEGLVLGEDYIMAWRGVTVPQRKIFNTPPEDVREIAGEITSVIGGS